MKNHTLVPCIWFDDQAEAAAAQYLQAFGEGRIVGSSRFPASGENPAQKPPGSVLTVELEVAGQRFTLLNGGPLFKVNPSISFFVNVDTPTEADRVFDVLAQGGQTLMPMGAYPWSERYGWVMDQHGVSWQVITGRRTPGGPTIVPCLMFVGAQHGRAEEAMRLYTRVFAGGHIERIERYGAGEGPENTVKQGHFVLAGQELVAMDSHGGHTFTFNEGLSLQVMCEDQETVDHYWSALADGGQEGPCGWLKDRFGLSWQVAPTAGERWMLGGDSAARDRAFAAMMTMKKLDIAEIERAFAGE